MSKNLNLEKTKETFDKILAQAKESVKILETLQKEGIAKARNFIHIPTKDETKHLANEKILIGLQKLGLATKTEVQQLEKKLNDVASELRSQITKLTKGL